MNFVPALLLALAVLCLCGFLGSGALIFFDFVGSFAAKRRHRKMLPQRNGMNQGLNGADALLTGGVILTGLAVTAHAAAVFTGQSFSRCTVIFLCVLGAALVLAAVSILFFVLSHKKQQDTGKASVFSEMKKMDSGERVLIILFGILAAMQLFYMIRYAGVYVEGDMTLETVGSFLQTDGIYQVDPMTGQAYTVGMPDRLKILCLPTLYGFLCRLSGLAPGTVVTAAVPIWVFVSSYAAFFCVGRSLFPESRKKRVCFLIIICILMWVGCSFHSLDGFGLLYCGYRGLTIRNLVLIPYLVSLCLRKKRGMALICIAAEACIVWTFYGMGVCLLTAAGLCLAERGLHDGRVSSGGKGAA